MPTTLSSQISALATQVGTDIKQIIANIGDLNQLTTSEKTSLVVALNELKAAITQASNLINDSATSSTATWSSSKISTQIQAAVNGLINGAPETLDTLKELATAIETNQDAITALQSIANGHVKFNEAQSLEPEQQQTARDNIGAAAASDVTILQGTVSTLSGTVSTVQTTANTNKTAIGTLANLSTSAKGNLVEALNEVSATASTAQQTATQAQGTANSANTAVTTLQTNVGDTTTDFVSVYEAARDGTA